MQWTWWLKNLIHIETLFVIGLIISVIYFLFFYKGGKKGKKVKIDNPFNSLPKLKIKKRPKKNLNEERCREIFQTIFSCRFKSIRPDWLKNPATGDNLELDGFNATIPTPIGTGLAFEYDGAQHSRYIKHFHRNGPEEFIYQTKKDAWKDKRCKEMGVLLIRIPHFVAKHDLERYIKQKLRRVGMSKWVDGKGMYG